MAAGRSGNGGRPVRCLRFLDGRGLVPPLRRCRFRRRHRSFASAPPRGTRITHITGRHHPMVARIRWSLVLSCVVSSVAAAQGAAPSASTIAPIEEQVAAAVLPLPAESRSTATVLGYNLDGKLTMLRKGTGAMTCLADDPKLPQFHVACYHDAMEPFMARGRELRASGVTGTQVDSVRFREAKSGALKVPTQASSLYSLTGGSFDPKTGT